VTAVAVADTLTALGDLALAWRRRFHIPVISLTGSCGKTTAKEMTALVLSRFFRVLKNDLNLNNLIGLPQTLLQLDAGFEAAVVEMGMNRFGEISRLTAISRPTVGVLLNVHPAHTEGVGCVEGVACAKGELISGLSPDAALVYNADDPRVACRAASFKGRRLGFGFGPSADVRALSRHSQGLSGQVVQVACAGQTWPLTLAVPGEHQVLNALAAVAVALALGLPAAEACAALADFEAVQRRSQVQVLPSGASAERLLQRQSGLHGHGPVHPHGTQRRGAGRRGPGGYAGAGRRIGGGPSGLGPAGGRGRAGPAGHFRQSPP
jgi:UDP-N-acetylmuramoyl-tripeptide--D-alanyl-D-alanine ligase